MRPAKHAVWPRSLGPVLPGWQAEHWADANGNKATPPTLPLGTHRAGGARLARHSTAHLCAVRSLPGACCGFDGRLHTSSAPGRWPTCLPIGGNNSDATAACTAGGRGEARPCACRPLGCLVSAGCASHAGRTPPSNSWCDGAGCNSPPKYQLLWQGGLPPPLALASNSRCDSAGQVRAPGSSRRGVCRHPNGGVVDL